MTNAERPMTAPERELAPMRLAIAGVVLALAAIAVGLTFGGWLQHGAAILATMAESGLSWCL
jgi:hypothetical protein